MRTARGKRRSRSGTSIDDILNMTTIIHSVSTQKCIIQGI